MRLAAREEVRSKISEVFGLLPQVETPYALDRCSRIQDPELWRRRVRACDRESVLARDVISGVVFQNVWHHHLPLQIQTGTPR